MPILVGPRAAPIQTQLPNNVVPASNPLAGLEGPVSGVLNAMAGQQAGAVKAQRGAALADLETSLTSIKGDVGVAKESPIVAAARADLDQYNTAVSQITGSRSALANILMESRARRTYQQLQASGDVEGASAALSLYQSFSGGRYGQASSDVVEKEEIKAEKIAEQRKTIMVDSLKKSGNTALALDIDNPDPKVQDEINKVLAQSDANTRNEIALDNAIKANTSLSGALNLHVKQQEVHNQATLTTPMQGLALSGRSIVDTAIKTAVSRPLDSKDADPNLIAAQVVGINQQFDELELKLNAGNVPGMGDVYSSTRAVLQQLRASAVAAATNSDGLKAAQNQMAYLSSVDAARMPKAIREVNQFLPILGALANVRKSGLTIDHGTDRAILALTTSVVNTVNRGLPTSISAQLTGDTRVTDVLAVAQAAIKDNLKQLGEDPTNDNSKAMLGYVLGASNDMQHVVAKDRVSYGKFLAATLANPEAVKAFKSSPTFNDPRNQARVLDGLSIAEQDITGAIARDLAASASHKTSSKVTRADLVEQVTQGTTVIFRARVSPEALADAKKAHVSAADVQYSAEQAANKMQAQYGNTYRNILSARENLVGKAPPPAAPLPEPTPAVKAPEAVSVTDEQLKKLLSNYSKMSPEDQQALLQYTSPAE